jgi:Tfp pilus assembly protein PilV
VEVLIAMLILTMGILGLAQTTAFVMRQVTVSDLSDNRAAALQGAVEQVRAIHFDSLGDGADTVGSFIVQWTVEATSSTRSRQVTFVTTGPGLETVGGFPQLTDNVAETLVYRVNRRY